MPTRQRYMAKVMHGTISKTPGGLTKKNIKTTKTSSGAKRYVSKKRSAAAKKNFAAWNRAVQAEKKSQGYGKHDFVLLKGAFLKAVQKRYYD